MLFYCNFNYIAFNLAKALTIQNARTKYDYTIMRGKLTLNFIFNVLYVCVCRDLDLLHVEPYSQNDIQV